MNNFIKSKLNDKYYIKYKYLFNYSLNKFNLINSTLLFNTSLPETNKICKYSFNIVNFNNYYSNILYNNNLNKKIPTNNSIYIIDKFYSNKTFLIITNTFSQAINYTLFNKKVDCDIINFYNNNYINFTENFKHNQVNYDLFKTFYDLSIFKKYKQFLIDLKNNNEENNIFISKTKYSLISCNSEITVGLNIMSSYKLNIRIYNLISTIAISLKLIEKNGTLILFWSILNINIPVIKKILSLLSYGFKNVEIIDNDINQNLLIGVPEYYIKCSGYKNNITQDLINKLLDIAIESMDYLYHICDILDYYEEYTEKNPNHSLFYNKRKDEKTIIKNRNRKYTRTKKSSTHKSSLTRKSLTTHKSSSTRKSSTQHSNKHVTPIYYIEDINISELNEIMKDSTLQFEVSLLMNKLEGIFVGYFKMVNNLIVNAITTNKNGIMIVKPEAILQKDITNLTRLITMFEYNKLPYNKHALKVLLGKQDELIKHFYALDRPINNNLIHYNDRTSKILNKSSITHFRLSTRKNTLTNSSTSKSLPKYYEKDLINEYYNRIKLAYQVKEKLLEDLDLKQTPPQVKKILYNFGMGLIQYINKNTINHDFLKLWEILDTFQLIPHTSNSFKVLHLAEITGQTIVCAKSWIDHKCPKLKSHDSHDSSNTNDTNDTYEWLANTINPYNKGSNTLFGNEYIDNYNLLKNNYNKWVFGNDNTGDLTKIQNIKSIMNEIKNTKNNNHQVDLIISDNYNSTMYSDNGRENTNTLDAYTSQKIDLSHVISVIACSTSGGSCCVKHFIPYVKIDKGASIENTIDLNNFFIGYLYLYYTLFDSISLYKPNTSNDDNGEFYVVGKGFKGVTHEQLHNLFKLLDTFVINTTIIEPEYIPETFINQIIVFLEDMSNLNILNLEKQNLLLTCYKNFDEENTIDRKKFQQTNKILKCNNLFNRNKIETMLIPKYKEWIKIYNF
jgi:hypothetical protein